VSRSQLVVALASVFAGLTVFSAVLGFAYSPVALVPAVLFGVVTYFLWYHASGQLRARVHRRARTATARTEPGAGGFGAGPREEWTGPRSDRRGFDGARRNGPAQQQRTGPSTAEAYRTLGLDPGADEAAVKAAYREKVKDAHPDTEDGDEQRFKRVNEAYEHLSD
jgi:DnaJ-domain-containing protein 1